jgi:AraC family transcriptional regulator, activator of mtrCDE
LAKFIFDGALEMLARYLGSFCNHDPSPRKQCLAPAVVALFKEPARARSLPDLARLGNMSRATLARQFQEKLGRSASDLLTDIRMTLATNELRKSSLSTGAVAEAVG